MYLVSSFDGHNMNFEGAKLIRENNRDNESGPSPKGWHILLVSGFRAQVSMPPFYRSGRLFCDGERILLQSMPERSVL